MKIWNFDNFFTEDVKKNHIFTQFLDYIAIHLSMVTASDVDSSLSAILLEY
jgi:hypothetical protein